MTKKGARDATKGSKNGTEVGLGVGLGVGLVRAAYISTSFWTFGGAPHPPEYEFGYVNNGVNSISRLAPLIATGPQKYVKKASKNEHML